tara:strand:- start:7176 stop:7751 length:576 start_codon:yes stop_codon:yes gene_type:complete
MPNHVFTRIEISDPNKKQKEILKKIEKAGGLCRHYKPMPKELEDTKGWYEWCCENWGTKWGCYELEIDDNFISFTSAWSPIGDNIISMFAKDFPSFTYSWEEEQGYGSEMDFEDGECVMQWDYDCPEWEEIEDVDTKDNSCYTITKLLSEHPNFENGVGYYADYSNDFLGKTLEEAKKELNLDLTIKSSAI